MKVHFTHDFSLRVRYGETDQMGYCYYGRYAEYFEIGRVETMRQLGISYKELEEKGIMLPVSELNVSYHKPAFYDEELVIRTTITEVIGVRITFKYEIVNAKYQITTTGNTVLVFVDSLIKKPIPAPGIINELLLPYSLTR